MKLLISLPILSLLWTSLAWAGCQETMVAYDEHGVWFQPWEPAGKGLGVVYFKGTDTMPGGMWARTIRSWSDVLQDGFVQRDLKESRQTANILSLENLRGKRVLDLGCGRGDAVKDLIREGVNAEGVDVYLDEEQAKLPKIFHRGNATQTGLPSEIYDVIFTSHSVFYYRAEPRVYSETANEAFRLLRPGGHFVILNGSQAEGHLLKFNVLERFSSSYLAQKPGLN